MKQSKQTKPLSLFCVGGIGYILIEILYRGYTHWTMFVLGGLCFVLCGLINERFTWDMPMWQQQGICAQIITVLEFLFGCILNLWLGLGIWNYSSQPFNILGQVCLLFTFAWYFLSAVAIILDDYLRYRLFGEQFPHYTWW